MKCFSFCFRADVGGGGDEDVEYVRGNAEYALHDRLRASVR